MKKLIAALLLLSLSWPLCSQSLSGIISDLEEVLQIISDLETDNKSLNQQLLSLQQNETQREQHVGSLENSAQKQEELLGKLSIQLKQAAQASQEQMKSYERLSLRFKILTYCTVGVTAAGAVGWILWGASR